MHHDQSPTGWLAWIAEYGAGHPDIRTADSVLRIVIPSARRAAMTDADRAMVDAAEAKARAFVEAFGVAA